jgi:parallel beta-helix repeat protein
LIISIFALDQYCKKTFPPGIAYRRHYAFYLKDIILKRLVISPIINVLFTKDENLSTTELPVWEIQLYGRKLAALNSDLPSSGRIYQSGAVIINSSPYPARFRYRGDGFWHWMSKQKSWKIKLRGGQRFEGKREFNLINSRSTTTLIGPLTSYIAKSMGLKTPSVQHVHARLNGQYLGVLCLLENFDHDFTAQNGLPEGALYEDEALGGPPYRQSWKRIDDWKIRPLGSKRKHQAGKSPEEKYEKRLIELLNCSNLKDDMEFFHKLEELVDIHQYLKWWAHTVIFLDGHQDRTHNNRLYLDPTSAKFQQIPWDVTIKWGNPHDEIDLNLNPITERLLQSAKYVHARNKIIWEALQGPASIDKQIQWLEKTTNLIREDIYCDSHKDAVSIIFPILRILSEKWVFSMTILPVTNSMFERDVNRIKTSTRERTAYLEQILSKTDSELVFYSPSFSDVSLPVHYTSVSMLNLQVGGQGGIVVEEIRMHFKSPLLSKNTPFLFYGNSGQLIKRKSENIQSMFSDDKEVYRFKVNELLLPGRKRKPPFGPTPVRYPFTVAFVKSEGMLPVPLRIEVKGVHSLTGQEVFLEAPLSELKDEIHSIPVGKFQSPSLSSQKIIWKDLKKMDKDFRVEKDEILVIRPGTRIEFIEGTSLLSYGKIIARGKSTSPIVFTRAPDSASWGVVALQGSKASDSVFEHCTFEYGSDDEIDRVFYSGVLSIYNADATVGNCLFRFNQGDDALNTKFSSTDVIQSTFINNTADAYDLDFSDGLISKNIFEKNGNDGIDCGTAHPTISGNRIFHCGDKGVSIGERSNPVVENNLIAYCKVGIAVKDQSCPEIKSNEFQFNQIAVSVYQKKKVFGGANVTIHESVFQNNEHISESDEVSSVSLIDCVIDDDVSRRNK